MYIKTLQNPVSTSPRAHVPTADIAKLMPKLGANHLNYD